MSINNGNGHSSAENGSTEKIVRPTDEKQKVAVSLLEKAAHRHTIEKELLEVFGEKLSFEEIARLDRERHERARDHGKNPGGFWGNQGNDHLVGKKKNIVNLLHDEQNEHGETTNIENELLERQVQN